MKTRTPRIDLVLANARGTVSAAMSIDQVMLAMHVESDGMLPHSVSVFFEPADALAIGEALMREGYRMQQMQKLKDMDFSARVPLPSTLA